MSSLLCSLLLRRDQQDGEHTKTHRGYPLSLWHLLRLNLSQTKPHCRPLRKREEGQKRAWGCVPRILYIFVGLFVMSIRNAWHSLPSPLYCLLSVAGRTDLLGELFNRFYHSLHIPYHHVNTLSLHLYRPGSTHTTLVKQTQDLFQNVSYCELRLVSQGYTQTTCGINSPL